MENNTYTIACKEQIPSVLCDNGNAIQRFLYFSLCLLRSRENTTLPVNNTSPPSQRASGPPPMCTVCTHFRAGRVSKASLKGVTNRATRWAGRESTVADGGMPVVVDEGRRGETECL